MMKGQYTPRISLNGTYLRDRSAPQTNSFLKSPKQDLKHMETGWTKLVELEPYPVALNNVYLNMCFKQKLKKTYQFKAAYDC